jgi:hypothetical protein
VLQVHQGSRSAQKRPDPPQGGKAVLGGVETQNGGRSKGSFGANYDTHPPSVATPAVQPRGIPPLFKADTVNIAVSASKGGKLRVVYGGWDDAKVVLGAPSTGSCLAPAVRAARPAVTCNVGRRGGLSRHRYISREVLLGPVDET